MRTLLAVWRLDRQLGVLAEAARRRPDPRFQPAVTHSAQWMLTQRVDQILGGYFDGNDAQLLRHDPLFQTLCDVPPGDDRPLASGSTVNRFQHAYTRREAEKPPEDRAVLLERRVAHLERIRQTNRYLVELFTKTRCRRLERIVLDVDATDDPTHGQRQLSLFDGYRRQYQYKPLLVFEGETGFPLARHLRPGTAHDSWGAVDVLREIVAQLRARWPHARTVIAKVEVMPQGVNRRFVVTNIRDSPQAIYHGLYVRRGDVPPAVDRRVEKRPGHRPAQFAPLSGQRLDHVIPSAGLRAGGVVSRSERRVAGIGHGGSFHVAQPVVQGGRGGQHQRAADLVPLQLELAAPRVVGVHL